MAVQLDPAVAPGGPGVPTPLVARIINLGSAFLGVAAQSQAQSAIGDEDTFAVEIASVEGVAVALLPAAQTVSGTLEAAFTLVVTNTGNAGASFQFVAGFTPGGAAWLDVGRLPIPPRAAMRQLVAVQVSGGGTYQVEASASSGGAQAGDTASLEVLYAQPGPQFRRFLPIILKRQGDAME